ncbi:hypothetical protein Bca52824_039179 [Brassica carinata]|uniref:TF-B3 domain-containing protein n=1 Tax=Brassica carinata TaxID=52824 RepID=A0A8X7RT74_BRACI|nr:hypothetical protein Bca52824_039179 [Brassica carinata]
MGSSDLREASARLVRDLQRGGRGRGFDIAARRFRGRDAVTNFRSPASSDDDDAAESAFLEAHSKAEIVDMLRKHTYDDELQQSRRKFLDGNGKRCESKTEIVNQNDGVSREHFPLPVTVTPSPTKGVLINLEDRTGKVWRFRYSYWNSSQSYVLTKGWSRFVKEKNLRAGDVVCFERSSGPDQQLYIDWKVRSGIEKTTSVQTVVRLFGVNIFNATTNANTNDAVGRR